MVYIWVSDQCSQPVNSPSTPGCQQSVYSRMLTVRLLQDVNRPSTPGCQQSVYSRMSTVRLLQDVNRPSTPGCQKSVGSRALHQCSLLSSGSLGFLWLQGTIPVLPPEESSLSSSSLSLLWLRNTILVLPPIQRLPWLPLSPGHYIYLVACMVKYKHISRDGCISRSKQMS